MNSLGRWRSCASSLGRHHLNAMSNQKDQVAEMPRLNWIRTGTEHSETVVLIHAVGYDLTYWDRQIEVLQADYNVVAFDLPGHGNSPGKASDWSFDYAAALVASLIEHVGIGPIHLVGISFGGMIAQATVLARPELVSTLTLIGTACTFPSAVREGMKARAQTIRTSGMAAVMQSSLERWYTATTREHRPDIIDRVCKTVLADDPETQAAIWEIVSNFEVRERLGEIKVPTLVLVGEQDPSTPPSAALVLAEGISGAKVVVIPGASHLVTVEAPSEVNAALQAFLARARLTRTLSA
jgi:3-oxoadipate enol-lactonase